MRFPDIEFTEPQRANAHDGWICFALLKLDTMPSFLYTPVRTTSPVVTDAIKHHVVEEILRQARLVKAELNEIDLGVVVDARGNQP